MAVLGLGFQGEPSLVSFLIALRNFSLWSEFVEAAGKLKNFTSCACTTVFLRHPFTQQYLAFLVRLFVGFPVFPSSASEPSMGSSSSTMIEAASAEAMAIGEASAVSQKCSRSKARTERGEIRLAC